MFMTRFCLSWIILVGISPGFVCYGQLWLVKYPVLSVLDNIGWYIFLFCLSWTKMDGISTGFVCHGNNG